MVETREVLRRWLAGDGLRAIARGTGIDQKTIAKYMRAAAAAVGLQRRSPRPTGEQRSRAPPSLPARRRDAERGAAVMSVYATMLVSMRANPPGLQGEVTMKKERAPLAPRAFYDPTIREVIAGGDLLRMKRTLVRAKAILKAQGDLQGAVKRLERAIKQREAH